MAGEERLVRVLDKQSITVHLKPTNTLNQKLEDHQDFTPKHKKISQPPVMGHVVQIKDTLQPLAWMIFGRLRC